MEEGVGPVARPRRVLLGDPEGFSGFKLCIGPGDPGIKEKPVVHFAQCHALAAASIPENQCIQQGAAVGTDIRQDSCRQFAMENRGFACIQIILHNGLLV